MSTSGGYHEYIGIMSTSGGYHEYIGGYHEYIGGCIMSTSEGVHQRDTMSTSGDVQYIGGIP